MRPSVQTASLITLCVIASLSLAVLTSDSARAADETADAVYLIAQGRVTYKVYCASCHGAKGEGDGTLAEYLTVEPTDLTRLAGQAGGAFPSERVRRAIDGRDQIRGHGNKEMPVWGDAFQRTLQPTWKEETDEERAERKILEVVSFLESIQNGSGQASQD
jgi:mono/diheme cytochrome c family protein